MSSIARDRRLTPAAMVVGVELCNQFRIKSQQCLISLSDLMRFTGLPKRSIQRGRDTLREFGYIEYSDHKGRGNVTEYQLIKGDTGDTFYNPGEEEESSQEKVTLVTPFVSEKNPEKVTLVTRKGDTGDTFTPIIDTVKNCKDNVRENKKRKPKFNSEQMRLAERIYSHLLDLNPEHKKPNLENWARDIRLIVERDKKSLKQIYDLFLWANMDHFWKRNILSPGKLREKWDQLTIQRNSTTGGGNGSEENRQAGRESGGPITAATAGANHLDVLKELHTRARERDRARAETQSD